MAKTEGVDAAQLTSFIERIERLDEEMSNIRRDISEIYAEAKEAGYDPKIMRSILRLKKMDEADRSELDLMTETYRTALDI
ncbi:MAG: DUF2312 domain-containing protein [Rickettsiales bacterium]|jgi:uncharacterized protein (UPF0335 family)|nr:DUF2312 domain-containing protein [Rickettsiales bacterium]